MALNYQITVNLIHAPVRLCKHRVCVFYLTQDEMLIKRLLVKNVEDMSPTNFSLHYAYHGL